VANDEVPVKDMVCSEFAVYAYQGTSTPYMELDARHSSPQRLESYLNGKVGSTKFDFVGVILDSDRKGNTKSACTAKKKHKAENSWASGSGSGSDDDRDSDDDGSSD
jgi:hypothetical protein